MAAFVFGLGAAQATAQCLEQQQLTASDAVRRAQFGYSVSVSGDTAVVGARGDGLGAAYVYRFNGASWVQEQKLTASDAASEIVFGTSVSVSRDTVVAGAFLDDCAAGHNCGSAYVFRFNGTSWIEEQKLTASDPVRFAEFGGAVSLSGDTVVVGAAFKDCAAGNFCGSAYVYRFNGTSWVEEQKLTASDAASFDNFGISVSLSGDTAAVGAWRNYCTAGVQCGAAYVFRFNGTTWVEEQKLTASDANFGDLFGASVSVTADTVVVGAPKDNRVRGSAYVYRFNGTSWVEEQKLAASDTDATVYDGFGSSVFVSGQTAVVGAAFKQCTAGTTCGSAYVYRFNGTSWVQQQKLIAPNAAFDDRFGISVSVSGDTVAAGAGFKRCADGERCGAVYVYSCVTVAHLDIKPGSCPNPVNPKAKGVVPVALVGSLAVDVAMVDRESLTLSRADGIGEGVTPLSGDRGPGMVIADLATPVDGEPCACHEPDDHGVGDGIDDLLLKFSTSEMSRAFELDALRPGSTVELVLRGSLEDGTTFKATDCIVIPGTDRDARGQRGRGKSK